MNIIKMNISKSLKGRMVAFTKNNGQISYYRITGENEGFYYLKELFVPPKCSNYTSVVNGMAILANYDIIQEEHSVNEFISNYSVDDLAEIKRELLAEGHGESAVDKIISEFFSN